jgi:hypothetical protein
MEMSDSGIGQGADSFFQDPDTVDQDKSNDKEKSSEEEEEESGTPARDRKQVAMYLPGETAENLRRGWHRYAADNPDATKNNDYFPDVIEAGLEALDLD